MAMFNYLQKSKRKFTDDVLAKAVYDILKYFIIALISYLAFSLIPKETSLGKILNQRISLTYLHLAIIVVVAVSLTVIIYFLFNRKKFALIKLDLLTDRELGIPNNRALEEELPKALNWAKAENAPLSIILLDVDNFKKFNTDYTDRVADKVLAKLAKNLKDDNQLTDKIYRQHLKGDEFVIVVKDTSLEAAERAADRRRKYIARLGVEIPEYEKPFKLTVCCGVAEFNPKEDTEQTLLDRASRAMKEAKQNPGKNKTVCRD